MTSKQFVSTKKAVRLTGQSMRMISHFCETHRSSKYVRMEDGLYRVRLDFLAKHFGIAGKMPLPTEVQAEKEGAAQPEKTSLLTLLESQLAEKDRQLAAKDIQLAQLIERNREQNNIIFSLEQRAQALETRSSLALPERHEPAGKGLWINYWLVGLTALLVGVVLIILYGLLLA